MRSPRVRIKRMVQRPLVISPPGIVRTLQQDPGTTRVPDNKDNIALPIGIVVLRYRGQPPKIDSAGPIGRNLQRRARLPSALAHSFRPDWRIGLYFSVERTNRRHQATTL